MYRKLNKDHDSAAHLRQVICGQSIIRPMRRFDWKGWVSTQFENQRADRFLAVLKKLKTHERPIFIENRPSGGFLQLGYNGVNEFMKIMKTRPMLFCAALLAVTP